MQYHEYTPHPSSRLEQFTEAYEHYCSINVIFSVDLLYTLFIAALLEGAFMPILAPVELGPSPCQEHAQKLIGVATDRRPP